MSETYIALAEKHAPWLKEAPREHVIYVHNRVGRAFILFWEPGEVSGVVCQCLGHNRVLVVWPLEPRFTVIAKFETNKELWKEHNKVRRPR